MKSLNTAPFVLLAALSSPSLIDPADARYCGGVLAPRRYRYNRPARDTFDLVSDIFSVPVYMNSLMRQHETEVSRLFQSNEPRYSVHEDPETGVVELTIELPGVHANDVNIELEDNRILRITGTRKYSRHGTVYDAEFDQSFRLNEEVDPERLKVTLSAGILRVEAPKRAKLVRQIPVLTGDREDDEILPVSSESKDEVADAKVVEETNGVTITEDAE